MVFQDIALWPHMTVYKNIDFGLKVFRVTKAKKIESVLNKVNMKQANW
jgi:ABC-type Fe3+/spermidine/putrescine transport system ATPase subunit